jgi:hypothetical protein
MYSMSKIANSKKIYANEHPKYKTYKFLGYNTKY